MEIPQLTPEQKIWEEIMPVMRSLISPVTYCEMGDTFVKFSKDGKEFEIKIKEVKK